MTTLAEELTNDPLGIGYAGMSDREVELSLVAQTRTKVSPRLITERGVLSALPVPDGDVFLAAMENFAAASLPDGHPLAAYHGTIKRGVGWLKTEGLDLGDPLSRTLLDTMAAAGVVDAASVATLKALAEHPCSRAEELGIVVNDIEIRAARG